MTNKLPILETEAVKNMNVMMRHLFVKNMELFRQWQPKIYKYFLKYHPVEMDVRIMKTGSINLFNKKSGSAVYPDDVEEYFSKQVESYLAELEHITVSAKKPKSTEGELFSGFIDEMFLLLEGFEGEADPEYKETIQLQVMLGLGFGLQVQHLLNAKDIHNLFVYEPHPDAFFASMHLIDWAEIKRYFDRDGYSIFFSIGAFDQNSYERLMSYVRTIGTYNAYYAYVYKHYSSPQINSIESMLVSDFPILFQGLGYYDDEKVGLSHTIENCKNSIGFVRNVSRGEVTAPVFIVGNGPSLDSAIPFIKDNRDKILVVSCGTSLASLYKKGIKPDIHVEQERVQWQHDVIVRSTDEEYRKGITLLTLNTVHPKVHSLFEHTYAILKPNDLGTSFLQHEYLNFSGYEAVNCNPVVANTGVAICEVLGFKNIYLVGIDCGARSPAEQHHAGDSFYSDLNEDERAFINKDFAARFVLKREGNYGGFVYTDRIFDSSRKSIETVLSSGNIDCKNASDGVKIVGAEPVVLKDVDFVNFRPLGQGFTQMAINDCDLFYAPDLEVEDRIENYLKEECVNEVASELLNIYGFDCSTKVEIFEVLYRAHLYIYKLESSNYVLATLLRGSVDSFNLLLNSKLYLLTDVDAVSFYKKALSLYRKFVVAVASDLGDWEFDLHKTSFNERLGEVMSQE